MAILTGCDIYAGRSKDVAEYRIRVDRLTADGAIDSDGERAVERTVKDKTLCMCPAAEKRLTGFLDRGTSLPGKAETCTPQ